MGWLILGAIVCFFLFRFMWGAYTHPSHVLVRQAANMNWIAVGRANDGDGYKNVRLSRDGVEAEISFLNGNVRLIKPSHSEPFSDFIKLEHWLVKSHEATVEGTPKKRNSYGLHISEMDIAIETHKIYAKDQKIFVPLRGDGKSINWNSCASVYASMRYSVRKKEANISRVVWNTIIHSIVVRMATEENDDIGMGDPEYQALENEAYSDLEMINGIIEECLLGKGLYTLEPIVKFLIMKFGGYDDQNSVKALSTIILMNARKSREKIIPELLEAFS